MSQDHQTTVPTCMYTKIIDGALHEKVGRNTQSRSTNIWLGYCNCIDWVTGQQYICVCMPN